MRLYSREMFGQACSCPNVELHFNLALKEVLVTSSPVLGTIRLARSHILFRAYPLYDSLLVYTLSNP